MLEWGEWFDNRRVLEPIGNVPPAEAEARYYAKPRCKPWPPDPNQTASGKPGAFHLQPARCAAAALALREWRSRPDQG